MKSQPAATTFSLDVTGGLERVRATRVGEEDVFGVLSLALHGLNDRLEVPIRGYEDGSVISVLEGAGQHVHGQADVDPFLLEHTVAAGLPFLKVAQPEHNPITRLNAVVVASLPGDLLLGVGTALRSTRMQQKINGIAKSIDLKGQ